jgi:hypothetical protein
MKVNSPSGFNCRHSAVMRAAASCERPMKYARGYNIQYKMVSLPDVQSSNTQIANTLPAGLVAVFVVGMLAVERSSILEIS